MYSKILTCLVVSALSAVCFAQKMGEEREQPRQVLGDITPAQVKEIRQFITEYGHLHDAGDLAGVKKLLVGDPEHVRLHLLLIELELEASQVKKMARETLVKPDAPNNRPRTSSFLTFFGEGTLEKKGDTLTLTRPGSKFSMAFRSTSDGWRVVSREADLQGLDPKVVEQATRIALAGWKMLLPQVEAKEFKTYQEFAEASRPIEKAFKDAMRSSGGKPATQPN